MIGLEVETQLPPDFHNSGCNVVQEPYIIAVIGIWFWDNLSIYN